MQIALAASCVDETPDPIKMKLNNLWILWNLKLINFIFKLYIDGPWTRLEPRNEMRNSLGKNICVCSVILIAKDDRQEWQNELRLTNGQISQRKFFLSSENQIIEDFVTNSVYRKIVNIRSLIWTWSACKYTLSWSRFYKIIQIIWIYLTIYAYNISI